MALRSFTPINRSGTITLGGTVQTVAAANPNRNGFRFVNNSANAMWISDNSVDPSATEGYPVAAGASLYMGGMDGGPMSNSAIKVFCATSTSKFTAVEF